MKRILVVDDEDQVRFVVGESLKALGSNYEISTVENGDQALALFKNDRYDLVITDLKMPGMSGIKLTENIRDISPETPIIWMTAYGGQSVKVEAHKLDVRRFLTKPLKIEDFRKIAKQALETTAKEQQPMNFPADEPNEALNMRLEKLRRDSGATASLIISFTGQLITMVGGAADFDIPSLSALVAANFLAANEISRILKPESKFKVSYHESDRHNIYAHRIGKNYLLVTIFRIKTRPGSIWFYVQRAAMDLLEVLTDLNVDNQVDGHVEKIFTKEISDELGDLLDAIWEPTAETESNNKPVTGKNNELHSTMAGKPSSPTNMLSLDEILDYGNIQDDVLDQ